MALSKKILVLWILGLMSKTAFSRFAPAPSPNPEADSPAEAHETGPSRAAPVSAPTQEPAGAPLTSGPASLRRIFDVTKYGAVADGKTESQLAFSSTWSAACDWDGEPTFLIPKGTFFVGPVAFRGPCYNTYPLKIEIDGTLRAPSDLKAFDEPSWIIIKDLNNFILTGNGTGLVDGQGEQSYARSGCHSKKKCKEYPYSIRFQRVSNGTISDISLLNSKYFHMSFLDSSYIQVNKINITAPERSPNTDGIHLSHSSNISITSSSIGVGDDCVSIGPGNTNITIFGINCGPGHGISVGSLGKYKNEKDVVGVSVKNCTINGTTNGVRIKTWPGQESINVKNITFENVRMINVSNPIIIDQKYCPGHSCDSDVSSVKLSNIHFRNIKGTSRTSDAVNLFCSPKVPCENVQLKDVNLTYAEGGTSAKSTCFNIRGAYSTCTSQSPAPSPTRLI